MFVVICQGPPYDEYDCRPTHLVGIFLTRLAAQRAEAKHFHAHDYAPAITSMEGDITEEGDSG